MMGEVPTYGVFEAMLSVDRVKKLVEMFREVVGSKPVVRAVSVDGGIVKVELVDGRVIEVQLSKVLSFVADVVPVVIYVLGKKVLGHLMSKCMAVLSEAGREAGIEKVEIYGGIEVEVREAVSIIDAVLDVLREIGYE
jgi:hypothetical protein